MSAGQANNEREAGMASSGYIVVSTEFEKAEEADAMALALVEAGIVAAAHVSPIATIYIWKGKLCRHGESELSCITRAELFDDVRKAIEDVHPYEVCQVIATPICDISESFAAWIDESVGGASQGG